MEVYPEGSGNIILEKLGISKIEDVDSTVSTCMRNFYGLADCGIEKVLYGENIVFVINHGAAKYAFKIHVFSTAEIGAYVKLLEVIIANNFQIPPIMRTKEDRIFCHFQRCYGVLYEWVTGSSMKRDYPPHRQAVACALRKIHDVFQHLPFAESFSAVPLPSSRAANLKKLLSRIRSIAEPNQVADAYEEIVASRRETLDKLESSDICLVLTHEDMRGDNFFFKGDSISYIIDWECCRRQYRIDSIAQTALAYCRNPKSPKVEDMRPPTFENITGFLKDYCGADDIFHPGETEAFYALIAIHAARNAAIDPQSFMMYAEDWLNLAKGIIRKNGVGNCPDGRFC